MNHYSIIYLSVFQMEVHTLLRGVTRLLVEDTNSAPHLDLPRRSLRDEVWGTDLSGVPLGDSDLDQGVHRAVGYPYKRKSSRLPELSDGKRPTAGARLLRWCRPSRKISVGLCSSSLYFPPGQPAFWEDTRLDAFVCRTAFKH